MTKEEIIEEALRYIPKEDIVNFPDSGDLFFFAITKENEEPKFGGYGLTIGYSADTESKPLGKWIHFSYIDLDSFPPEQKTIKLQPPHIATGKFSSSDRLSELLITNLEIKTKTKEETKIPIINKRIKGVCTFYEFPKELWHK